QGTIPTVTLPFNTPSDFIPIPEAMHLQGNNLIDLIQAIYFDIARNSAADPQYFVGRAILTAKNKDVSTINDLLLRCLPDRKVSYFSHDCVCEPQNALALQVEYLNSIETGSLPPHILELKIGAPIMVIRNIDPAAGVCNGTRLIVRSLGTNTIEATIATGPKAGNIVHIPRIKIICSASDGKSPYDFARVQFPVRLAFAMTINKAQGQTLDSIGLYLPSHVFGHGQLYVAMSRVRTPSSIKLLIEPEISQIPGRNGFYTHNIVFEEVFNQ
ncbi:hypothetical protein, partial, partial [Parasitella parasitica]